MGTQHVPVLLNEILDFARANNFNESASYLDVTAGGGGHFFAIMEALNLNKAECWDRDPRAEERIFSRARDLTNIDELDNIYFVNQRFGRPSQFALAPYDLILADFGVSSFQLEGEDSPMSLFGRPPPDFRMSPMEGEPFSSWLSKQSVPELTKIFEFYGEEPRAKKLAHRIQSFPPEAFQSAAAFATEIAKTLAYPHSKRHPATRIFQALRIAINEELWEIESFMQWAPEKLKPGGIIMCISFHSLEDRIVKNIFREKAGKEGFRLLTKKPVIASSQEEITNPRSRSAKLRVIMKEK